MKYKVYSPTVEAYILSDTADGPVFYNVTDDIVSGGVTRNLDAPSTFYLRLQNKQNKWNGKLHPMDRITIYATKRERYQLLTGYISSATAYALWGQDMRVSGYDTLYRLQNYYWNPNTDQSFKLLYDRAEVETNTTGFCRVLAKLLALAGQNAVISGFPTEVMDWAAKMYSANVGDASGDETYKKFIKLLSLGGKLGSSNASSSSTGTSSSSTGNAAQQKVVDVAKNAGQYGCDTTYGHCLAFVNDVYAAAGYAFDRLEGAIDVWLTWPGSTSSDNIPMGACVIGSGSGDAGAQYGHIGIYDGAGNVIDNEGAVTISTFDKWTSWQTASCDGYTGYIGWTWPGVNLSNVS